MLKKRYIKSRKVWKLTFQVPEAELPKPSKSKASI